jgi:uncharacterized protein (UPF0548 family)
MGRLVEALENAEPTYADLGVTLAGIQPDGFRHDRYEVVLGQGFETFERAVRGLKGWEAHRQPGIRVFPSDKAIQTGATVIVTFGSPLVGVAAPCRIVSVVGERTRWGFAYGTLPGHPEQGEEAFIVLLGSDDTVRFEITAFSRPSDPLVRLSGPVGRGIQRWGTNGYLRALQRFVEHRD